MTVWIAAWLSACATEIAAPVPPPDPALIGTWRDRDQQTRLVFTAEGTFQYTQGKWTNTGMVVGWTDQGFLASAYPEPELHTITVRPHAEGDGATWMTVDDRPLYRQTTDAVIGTPQAPPRPAAAPTGAPAP